VNPEAEVDPVVAAAWTALVEAIADRPPMEVPCIRLAKIAESLWLSTIPRQRRDAATLCATCPVADLCRGYAAAVAEPFGVWGGLDCTAKRA
jgi:hypothetical protein